MIFVCPKRYFLSVFSSLAINFKHKLIEIWPKHAYNDLTLNDFLPSPPTVDKVHVVLIKLFWLIITTFTIWCNYYEMQLWSKIKYLNTRFQLSIPICRVYKCWCGFVSEPPPSSATVPRCLWCAWQHDINIVLTILFHVLWFVAYWFMLWLKMHRISHFCTQSVIIRKPFARPSFWIVFIVHFIYTRVRTLYHIALVSKTSV